MGRLIELRATLLTPGAGRGLLLSADEPLSFWGGVDPHTGGVIDRRHPLFGEAIGGRVLSLPSGRGSCSASGVLLEAIANGVAPAAIIVSQVDPIIGLGAILGDELLARPVPVALLAEEERRTLPTGAVVSVSADGRVTVELL